MSEVTNLLLSFSQKEDEAAARGEVNEMVVVETVEGRHAWSP